MAADAQGPSNDEPLDLLKRWPHLRRWAKLAGALIAAAGIAGAGIGYISGGAIFFAEIREHFQGKSELHTLIAAADDRLAHGDYAAAWSLNMKARQLSPRDTTAAARQIVIAMKWLENAQQSLPAGQNFSTIVDPLKAVLIERLPETQGREKADIQAHIGWANFLRSRDGFPSNDVSEEFESAIAEDPANFYGHLMRGFLQLWQGNPVATAQADFDIALKSTVDPAYADHLVMAALTNITSDAFMVGAITYADRIRQAGGTVDDNLKGRLIFCYQNSFSDKDLAAAFDQALPPKQQILLLKWLKEAPLSDQTQRLATYFIAFYSEKDGDNAEASRLYQELASTSADKINDDVANRAEAALAKMKQGAK